MSGRSPFKFPGLTFPMLPVAAWYLRCVLLRLAAAISALSKVSVKQAQGLPDRDGPLAGAEVRHMDAQHGAPWWRLLPWWPNCVFFFFFLGALEMWCGWGSSRCGPNDVFHTSHLFLSPTLPPPLRSISLFSTIWLESIFKSKPYFGRGGTVSVSVPGFSVWTGFGNRRLFYLISRSSSFSHGRDFLQFSHQHQPSTSSFSSRPPRSHMWCSLSESGFFLCTRKCTIVSGTCSHFTCEVSRVCPPSAPDSSEWRRHQVFPVARTSPVTDAVQTRPLCSPGTKHKWVLCFVAQSSREAWASSTNLRRGCPACPPPIPNVPSHLCKHSAADRTVVLACSLWTDCIWKCYGRSQSHSNNCSGHREEKARCTGMLTVCC